MNVPSDEALESNERPLDEHLSQIETLWSLVQAGGDPARSDAVDARQKLMERYGGSVRRYLMASLRDPDAVDDVYQEFSLRLIRGDLRRADRDRGKFRYYVKTIVYRLMMDHHRGRARDTKIQPLVQEPTDESAGIDDADFDAAFVKGWRDELLAGAWASLAAVESAGGSPHHTALKARVDHPDLPSPQLAEEIARRLGRSIQPGAARVMIHRAREKFAEALLDAVAESVADRSIEAIEEELIEVNLMTYCCAALEKLRVTL